VRTQAEKWVTRGQMFSERAANKLSDLIETRWLWLVVTILGAGGLSVKYRHRLKMQLEIWRVRHGRGIIHKDIVEELFYRATQLAEGRSPKRRPAQTWREWIFGLPDPVRRSTLTKALAVFEKSKYGRQAASTADFAVLEETIRELRS